MAIRRMFSRQTVQNDRFLALSHGAQLLYFHLGMIADHDGFVDSTRLILAATALRDRELEELADNGFIYRWEDGVVLILDWLLNNRIRRDRHTPSLQLGRKCIMADEIGRYVVVNAADAAPGDAAAVQEALPPGEEGPAPG